jgi:HEAT repeat protein
VRPDALRAPGSGFVRDITDARSGLTPMPVGSVGSTVARGEERSRRLRTGSLLDEEPRPPDCRTEEGFVRLLGAPNIEELERKGDVNALRKAVRSKHEGERWAAACALASLGEEDGAAYLSTALRELEIEEIESRLGDDNPHVRRVAAAVLAGFVDEQDGFAQNSGREVPSGRARRAVRSLIGALRSEDEGVRETALSSLRNAKEYGDEAGPWDALAGPEQVESLVAILEDESPDIRDGAVRLLGSWLGRRWVRDGGVASTALEPLTAALEEGSPASRAHAAAALGQLGDSRAVEPLRSLLDDDDPAVRSAVVRALEQLHVLRAAEEYAAEIVELERQTPGATADRRLREIGEELYAQGGEARMRAALGRAYGLGMTGRYVERLWTGIGTWVG